MNSFWERLTQAIVAAVVAIAALTFLAYKLPALVTWLKGNAMNSFWEHVTQAIVAAVVYGACELVKLARRKR